MDDRKRMTPQEAEEELRIFGGSVPEKAEDETRAADMAEPTSRTALNDVRTRLGSIPIERVELPISPEHAMPKKEAEPAEDTAPLVQNEQWRSIPITRAGTPQPEKKEMQPKPAAEKNEPYSVDTAPTREAPVVKVPDTAGKDAEQMQEEASDTVGYDWEPLVLHTSKDSAAKQGTSGGLVIQPKSAPKPAAENPVIKSDAPPKSVEKDGRWNSIPVSRETYVKPSAVTEKPKESAPKPESAASSDATREAERVVTAAPISNPPQPAERPTAHETAPKTDDAAPVSLDDFNRDAGSGTATIDMKKKKKRSFRGSAGFGVIKLVLYLAFVAVCVWVLSSLIWNVTNDVFAFIKADEEVTVYVPEGATTEDIASILKEADVIRYPKVFSAYAKFRISRRDYLTGNYLAGMHTVNPMHNFDTLIEELSNYERGVTGTVRITIPEGLTVNDTLELLAENGVGKKEDFLEALQSFEYEYRFAGMLKQGMIDDCRFDTNVSYRLEGYLFPDTYEFYLNENPIAAIDKFLVNFDKKFEEDFYGRCEALGMTVDQVITLASLIEKEGNNANDYYLISSVFHNRLKHAGEFPFLNSDAALQYAAGEHMELDEINTSAETPYNTYINRGLPPGPICNPSLEAIYAALYPEDTNYYYFYTKRNGETVYSRNINEHNNIVAADKAN